jgi:hypothetical protein
LVGTFLGLSRPSAGREPASCRKISRVLQPWWGDYTPITEKLQVKNIKFTKNAKKIIPPPPAREYFYPVFVSQLSTLVS